MVVTTMRLLHVLVKSDASKEVAARLLPREMSAMMLKHTARQQ